MKRSVLNFLAIYRCTPHATTGVAPSQLLHARHMRTKLDIRCATPDVLPPDLTEVKERVERLQQSSKLRTDSKKSAKCSDFKVGDFVRVKKHTNVKKGESKFSMPMQISKKLSSNTYVTADGKHWNAKDLAPFYRVQNEVDLLVDGFGLKSNVENPLVRKEVTVSNEITNEGNVRRSKRKRNKPHWWRDYQVKRPRFLS